MDFILDLINSDSSVFSLDELELFWGIKNRQVLKNKIAYYKKKWILISVARGFYAVKWKEIDKFELANKIYSPSYISFFSALYHHSIIFQKQDDIYLAYKKTDIKKILDFEIKLKFLKKEILFNPDWIIHNWKYSIASKERAFLDTIYLYKDIYFDNISSLDLNKIKKLFWVYNNKTLEKRTLSYFEK